jgi:hypothetical protein
MSALLPLTLKLAIALGIYALAGSLGVLLSSAERRTRLFEELVESPGLIFGCGVIAFAIGATWLMVHQEWITPLGIIVTLAGWIIAIEGVLLLAFPAIVVRFAGALRPVLVPACRVGIVLGVLLIILGLTGVANAVPDYMTSPV